MAKSWLSGFTKKIVYYLSTHTSSKTGQSGRGLLVFANTGEVIAAERILRNAGFAVEVKGPPPDLRTGCDMVVVFSLIRQVDVENLLYAYGIKPLKIVVAGEALLEPVSLTQIKDMGHWLMVRAANMKITVDKDSGFIVNISGGGCPDVPFLARELCGKKLSEAPEPLSLGHTLCCYSLQKAFDGLKKTVKCGS